MNLKQISFPVYQVKREITKRGTLLIYTNIYGDVAYLDDTSINLPTLGLRRLKLMETKPLVPLNKALFFLKDIIKVGNSQFIDSKGKLFKYTKSKFVNLEFKEITKIIPILTGGALIEVDNENPRYKVIYAPSIDEKYVGMLQVSPKAYLVYGFYTEKYEDTRRKI